MSSLGYHRIFGMFVKLQLNKVWQTPDKTPGKRVQYHTSTLIFIGYLPLLLRLANLRQS